MGNMLTRSRLWEKRNNNAGICHAKGFAVKANAAKIKQGKIKKESIGLL